LACFLAFSGLQNFTPAAALNITGAGASFPFPVYAYWAYDYREATDRLVNHQSIGSGGGVAQITRGTAELGACDAPVRGADLDAARRMQCRAGMGGTVPVVNLLGVAPGELKLTGQELADSFLGNIRRWNDPVLTARNPDVDLPDADILVVHR